MSEIYPTIAQSAVVAGALKILLWPAYHSTDFEVHRNWLALTYSLPLKDWYYEATSEWTLDYPPFFAYFEWCLSQVAAFADPAIVQVHNLNYASWQTVHFQRASVIISELLLVYALVELVRSAPVKSKAQSQIAALSILLSPGFLIIDHIHFQYNGAMYGLFLLSVIYARQDSGLLLSGVLFAALLCFKHIYLYLSPAYFVFLLSRYCLDPQSKLRIQFANCVKLGGSIMIVALLAFGPFLVYGQIPQLLSRLFPFSRGLCHAYWAPNIWALYSFADRLLIYASPYLKISIDLDAVNSVTRGLVGDTSFAVLPEIVPRVTFALTLAAQIPPLIKLFFQPTWNNFVAVLTLCAYASFLFGWHVHEKAVLLVIVPFSLIALKDRRHLAAFRPLAVAGHISLLPLLFTAQEFPVKIIYTVAWLIIFLAAFDRLTPASEKQRIFLLDRFSLLYTIVAIPLITYCSLLHQIIFADKLEFLPLMFISTYSAIGVCSSWVGFLVVFFSS